jgi:hypothetical protein
LTTKEFNAALDEVSSSRKRLYMQEMVFHSHPSFAVANWILIKALRIKNNYQANTLIMAPS